MYSFCDGGNSEGIGRGVFQGDSTALPALDYSLDKHRLPPNRTPDIQVGATCTFKALEWISKYHNGNLTMLSMLNQFSLNYPPVSNMGFGDSFYHYMGNGVNQTQFVQLVNLFFNATPLYSPSDIIFALNAGHPVIGFISPNTINDGHGIFIMGYDDNGIAYFDPATGTYGTLPPGSDLHDPYSILSHK